MTVATKKRTSTKKTVAPSACVPVAEIVEVKATDSTRNWSSYQTGIFDFVEKGTGNAIVEAVAGSGKSTTIAHAITLVPPSQSAIFLAFNKAIAEDLKGRGVNAKTFHSLTYMPVIKHKQTRAVDAYKVKSLADKMFANDETEAQLYTSFIVRLVSLAKQQGIGCLVPDIEQSWLDIIDHHGLNLESSLASMHHAIEYASDLLARSNADKSVDFDDLLYLAVKDGLVLQKYDFVFVDEAQDTNAIQRAILKKIMHEKSRLIAVGDENQSIYGFRGADSDSLHTIGKEFNCVSLPLSISYRCPKAVVAYAKQWCGKIESAPNAIDGIVSSLGTNWDHTNFATGDLVVCRTTRHLVTLCYRLIKNRINARVMGRDIGVGLQALVKKYKANSLTDLINKMDFALTREVEKLRPKKNSAAMIEAITDKYQTVFAIASDLPDEQRTVQGLLNVIDAIFSNDAAGVTMATIHKAKGMEANRVFWLNRSKCPGKWAEIEWQVQQEYNCMYVAATRAKQALFIIEDPSE